MASDDARATTMKTTTATRTTTTFNVVDESRRAKRGSLVEMSTATESPRKLQGLSDAELVRRKVSESQTKKPSLECCLCAHTL
jgi:hypothetical protein